MTMLSLIASVRAAEMAPPSALAVLPSKLEPEIVVTPAVNIAPPLPLVAELFRKALSVMVKRAPALWL